LSSARTQAVQWFNEPYRAVTAADFERLVLSEPFPDGVMEIARAKAVANHQSGIVTVIIVPRVSDPFTVAATPDFATTRDAVKSFLDQRRLVGTRLRVRAPIYTTVAVGIDVLSVPDADAGALEQAIRDVVVTFLHPVSGGEDGSGWPFGRPVSIHDLAPIVESVPGVAEVRRVLLDGDPERTECAIQELPQIGALNITVSAASTG
jgi:predicted phage baseplate assembly protein